MTTSDSPSAGFKGGARCPFSSRSSLGIIRSLSSANRRPGIKSSFFSASCGEPLKNIVASVSKFKTASSNGEPSFKQNFVPFGYNPRQTGHLSLSGFHSRMSIAHPGQIKTPFGTTSLHLGHLFSDMLFHPVRICKESPHSSPLHSDKQNTLNTRRPRKQKKD